MPKYNSLFCFYPSALYMHAIFYQQHGAEKTGWRQGQWRRSEGKQAGCTF
jgi:hypothetical protein